MSQLCLSNVNVFTNVVDRYFGVVTILAYVFVKYHHYLLFDRSVGLIYHFAHVAVKCTVPFMFDRLFAAVSAFILPLLLCVGETGKISACACRKC